MSPSASGSDRGDPPARARVTALVSGRVQGVGFRWWVRAHARALGLAGSVTNLPDGRVEVIAEGPRATLEELLNLLGGPGTPGHVANVAARWSDPSDNEPTDFVAR